VSAFVVVVAIFFDYERRIIYDTETRVCLEMSLGLDVDQSCGTFMLIVATKPSPLCVGEPYRRVTAMSTINSGDTMSVKCSHFVGRRPPFGPTVQGGGAVAVSS
jgi:hypothetical protein